MKTWQIELAIVALVLIAVAAATGGRAVEWVGVLAVLLSFAHSQVGFRLSEAEATRAIDGTYPMRVYCHRWLARYHVSKELCWLAYFVWLGAWSALVGVGVFLVYPAWRRFHVGRRPKPVLERGALTIEGAITAIHYKAARDA